MQCPCSHLYETEISEDSWSEEDFRSNDCIYPCCKCLDREHLFKNPYTKPPEREKQIDCLCRKCLEEKKEKPKVKGKFGLAYIIQTPKENSCKPLGWQVEFKDTPSQIDRNCEKMVKWVTCPPLGECNNMEANFLWSPAECEKLLSGIEAGKCCCKTKPIEKCCLIEIPKIQYLDLEGERTTCVCQSGPAKKEKKNCLCLYNKKQKHCMCASKNRSCNDSVNVKNNYAYLQKQFEKFMLCKKCCKALTKCTCNQPPRRQQKQLKSKRSPLKCPNRENERDVLNICKHCQKSKNYYCTIEEHICPSCGKVMEKTCYVKENCLCEQYNDSLDYIPGRDVCSKKKCRARDANKTESGGKFAENKTSRAEEKAPQTVTKSFPIENNTNTVAQRKTENVSK